jgi:indole-3-glycerol phosphate synthase
MATTLEKILEQKRREISVLKSRKSEFPGKRSAPRRPFRESLKRPPGLAIVAEVKKASPSKGVIRPDFDPVKIARRYEQAHVQAVSVLTDELFFQGSIGFLTAVRASISLPVLRKDFIIDELQVRQTAQIGADGVLLIAAILDDRTLADFYHLAIDLDIDPLVEVHTRKELDRVLKLKPALIGINNRYLSDFTTDIQTSIDLCKLIPSSTTIVAESGITDGQQARMLRDAGVNAVLVGESLMRLDDPSGLIRELSCNGGDV